MIRCVDMSIRQETKLIILVIYIIENQSHFMSIQKNFTLSNLVASTTLRKFAQIDF